MRDRVVGWRTILLLSWFVSGYCWKAKIFPVECLQKYRATSSLMFHKKYHYIWNHNEQAQDIISRFHSSVADQTTISNTTFVSTQISLAKSQYLLLPVSLLIGMLTAVTVLNTKKCISWFCIYLFNKASALTLLLASLALVMLSIVEPSSFKPLFPNLSASIISQTNSWRRLSIRLFALMVSVGSGFSVGLAGPAAEIGMALAQQISSAVYGASSYKNKDQDITDDEQLRCMAHCIVAGAAAGITANFNAPVTGLLYALEVTRTLFPMKTIENASQPLKDPVLHWLPLSISIIGALMVLRKPFLLDLAHPLPVQWLMMKSVPIVLENSSTTSRTLLLKLSLWLWFIGLAGMYGVAYRWFNQLKEVLLQQIQYQLSQISASSSSQITELKQIKPWQTFWQQWIWAGGVTACVCWVALQSGFNPQLSYNMNLVPMWLQMNNPKVLSLKFLSLFLISRVAVTSLSAASTSVGALVGGQFAPMFVFGAGLGGLLHRLSLKFVQLSSSTWNRPLLDMFAATELFPVFVLIGGSAWIACQTQSPLLSTVFVWEMTQSHWSMVPLIFMTNAVALWSSQRPTGKKNA